MSRLGINTGNNPNDGQGDPLRIAMGKINSNFQELYNTFGDGTSITSYASTAGISTLAKNLTGNPIINISGSSNTGITTTEHIQVRNITSSGVVTAIQFVGDGSQLTNVTALVGGLQVLDDNVARGVARELNFGSNITVTGPNGVGRVTVSVDPFSVISSGYALTAGVSTYSQSSGISTYSLISGFSTSSTYATRSEVSTISGYSTISGISTYSSSSGYAAIAGYSTNSNSSTYSTKAGISSYSDRSGISTYAAFSGVSTYSSTSGLSTTAGYAYTSGFSYYSASAGITTNASYAITSGIATLAQNLTGSPSISVTDVNISSGLNVNGISTFYNNVNLESNVILNIGGSNELQIVNDGSNSYITNASPGYLILRDNGVGIRFTKYNGDTMGAFNPGGSVGLFHNNSLKFETTSIGATVYGTFRTNQLTVSSGVITATTFSGSLSGNATSSNYAITSGVSTTSGYAITAGISTVSQGLTGVPNITVNTLNSGISTFNNTVIAGGATTSLVVLGDARITGILTIGTSSLTLDGTNNRITIGNNVTITEIGGASYSGVITATQFVGDGSLLTNLPNSNSVPYATTSGIASALRSNANVNTSGIITASSFVGSGSRLTGLTSANSGTYGGGTVIPQIIVDSSGKIISINNVSISTSIGGGGGGSGGTAGISVYDSEGVGLVGFAGTIDFGSGLDVSTYSSGIVTVSVSYAPVAGFTTISTYSSVSGLATNAYYAGSADYAAYSGISSNSFLAVNSNLAGYSTKAGISTTAGYATTAGISTYARTAGISTYAGISGISTYAVSAGIATNANIATYATTSGIATYATTAGVSTYAVTSGIATYAVTAGIVTTASVAQGLTGTPNITVGIITATFLIGNVTGNLTGTASTATNLANASNITTGTINVSRLSGTYNVDISGTAAYATTAVSATNATTSNTSVVSQGLTGTPNINVGVTTTTALILPNIGSGNIGYALFGANNYLQIGYEPTGRNSIIQHLDTVGSLSLSGRTVKIADYDGTTRATFNSTGSVLTGITTVYDLNVISSINVSTFNVGSGSTIVATNNDTGAVGIGSTAPTSKLDVIGNVSIVGSLSLSGSGNLSISGIVTASQVVGSNLNIVGITTTARLNVGTGGTVITTTTAGLVGIGTTNPLSGYNLTVGSNGIHIKPGGTLNIGYPGYFTLSEPTAGSGRISASPNLNLRCGFSGSILFDNPSYNMAEFVYGGQVDLYFAGSKKFQTSSSGVTVTGTTQTDNLNVGTAVTANNSGIQVVGIVTATSFSGSNTLKSRTTVTGVTTSIANNGIGNTDITGFKSYALMKVGLSTAGWLRIYTDSTSRVNDVSRSVGIDPAPGSGVIAEVVTTGISTTQIITPFVMGGNLNNPADTTLYAAITNLSGITTSISVQLTILQLEA